MARNEDYRPPGRTPEGKPEAAATPRDVVHVRVGSFVLIFAVVIGVIGLFVGAPVLTIAAGVVIVVTVVDMVLAVRGQRERGSGEAG
ncbi:hypothetical protein [Nonomuraea typhae]|uniref:DUF3040 domain-containing protein n=1 Tax=Nonomuraea typhae TaxID=2603600 RepID=A0ABW7YXB6_9ACTN